MPRSPYSDQVEVLVRQFDQKFVDTLNLQAPYSRDDVVPGDRYGICNFRSFGPDRNSRVRNAHTGFQPQLFSIEILLTLGAETWNDARAIAVGAMLDLDHSIPVLKEVLNNAGWIYDFVVVNEISQSMRQSVVEPHFWMVDVTAAAIAKMQIYKNAQGEHAIYETQPIFKI